MSTFDGICCPSCGDQSLALESLDQVACTKCGAKYEAADGVPVFTTDVEQLRDQIADARRVNPLWYEDVQPAEVASPWRHHLKKRRLYVQRVLERHIKNTGPAARILDLGCGDGNNLTWLSQYASRAYGSDYNPVRLTRAKVLNPDATLFLADILDYPAEEDAFDIIFFNHVIEHIPDDIAALKAVYRILKPGGLLVLGTPNEGAWWWQWAYRRDAESLKTSDHCHFYTAQTIDAKLKIAGFDVTQIHHMGWGPPDWALDGKIRQKKWVDDLFTAIGRVVLPRQASSLYLIATKR